MNKMLSDEHLFMYALDTTYAAPCTCITMHSDLRPVCRNKFPDSMILHDNKNDREIRPAYSRCQSAQTMATVT